MLIVDIIELTHVCVFLWIRQKTASFGNKANFRIIWHMNPRAVELSVYRAFHNVPRNYEHYYQGNQRTYLNGIFHSHVKTEKGFFLTTRDIQCVHHGWHGKHRYVIQVVAKHAVNIVSMCVLSAVVHTSNISSCIKKLFQFSCGCEQFH
jgi:hypothetical protein